MKQKDLQEKNPRNGSSEVTVTETVAMIDNIMRYFTAGIEKADSHALEEKQETSFTDNEAMQ